jgi:hypothetical protein
VDRPKLYLVPASPPVVQDKSVLQFGRHWKRREGWHQVRPRNEDMVLHLVPQPSPSPGK